MKNKKIVLTITVVLLLSVTLLSLTACNKDNGFNINTIAKGAENNFPSQFAVQDLSAYSEYSNMISSGNYLFFSDTDEETGAYKYCLYSLEQQKVLTTGTSDSAVNVSTSFFSDIFSICVPSDSVNFMTTFYDYYGEITSFPEKKEVINWSYESDLKYIVFEDNSTILLDKENKGRYISYSPNHQVKDMTKAGDLFLYNQNGVTYVYDENLYFLTSYIVSDKISAPSGYTQSAVINLTEKKIYQYTQEVTDEEEPYDFVDSDGNRYNIRQYLLDVKTGNVTKLSNEKLFISASASSLSASDYYVLEYQKTSGKGLSLSTTTGIFDKNLNLTANLSEYVDYETVSSIDAFGDYLIIITSQHIYFYKDGKLAYKMSASYATNPVYGRYFYGNLIYFDALTLKNVVGIPADAVLQETNSYTDGLMYYKSVKEVTGENGSTEYVNEAYVFDTETMQATLLDDTGNIRFYTMFYSTYNEEANTYSAYALYNNQAIFENKTLNSLSSEATGDYTVITATQEDGSALRYAISLK